MMNQEIVWEPVTKIEILDDYDHEYVYDLSVDDIETFTVSNGIVVHNTLNTFHGCGISSKSSVNLGVPRIRELISVTKNPDTPSMNIYFKKKRTFEELKNILHTIEAIKFQYLMDNSSVWYDPKLKIDPWMSNYYEFYKKLGIEPSSQFLLRLEIYPIHLLHKNISMLDVYQFILECAIKKKYTMFIVYSDENEEACVFHIRFKTPVPNEMKLLQEFEKFLVSHHFIGCEEVKHAVIEKANKDEFIMSTNGTNLTKIFMHPEIDATKTYSNDLFEVYQCLGIEAARNVFINEMFSVLNNSGVTVLPLHVELLADNMTVDGTLVPMNRYGINRMDVSIMSKVSFEEPDEHLVQAALYSKSDDMNGVVSNVTLGQQCKFGTGLTNVMWDNEKWEDYQKYPMDIQYHEE